MGLSRSAGRPRSRRTLPRVALAIAIGCALSCAEHGSPERSSIVAQAAAISDGWLAMGTFFEVELRVRSGDEDVARDWLAWSRREVARLEAIYSRHDPSSELSDLNRRLEASPRARAAVVSDSGVSLELATLLEAANRFREETGGAFDVFYASPRADLDAISKGAVLDVLGADFARRFPGAAALLSLGQSSVVAIGAPAGSEGWRLRIQSRDPARGLLGDIALRDRALSVSSSLTLRERPDEASAGKIVDPRSGAAVDGPIEAIVIADSAMAADAWSTALLVLGSLPAQILAASGSELEARVYDARGRISQTSRFPDPERR